MKRVVIIGVLIAGVLSACSSETESTDKVVLPEKLEDGLTIMDSLITIQLPKNLKETESLDDHAYKQYKDMFRQQYLVVFAYNKDEYSEGLENFAQQEYDAFTKTYRIVREAEWKSMEIAGLPSKAKAVDAKVYGRPGTLSYWYAFIDGAEKFYVLKLWTPESRKPLFEQTANLIIRSFKEEGIR